LCRGVWQIDGYGASEEKLESNRVFATGKGRATTTKSTKAVFLKRLVIHDSFSFNPYCTKNKLKLKKTPADGHCLIYEAYMSKDGHFNGFQELLTDFTNTFTNTLI